MVDITFTYDVSLFMRESLDYEMVKWLRRNGGLKKFLSTVKEKSGLSRDYANRIYKDAKIRSVKEMYDHGFKLRDHRWVTHGGLEADDELTGELYSDILNENVADGMGKYSTASTMAHMFLWLKEEIEIGEGKTGKKYRRTTKMDLLGMVSQVMAEFIEDGMRSRLQANGLGDSKLYRTLEVYPTVVAPKGPKKEEMGDIDVRVGVTVRMKYYGYWVDQGRGKTQSKDGDSGFYDSLYEWALDNIQYAGKGNYTFDKYKGISSRQVLKEREILPKAKSMEYHMGRGVSNLGMGSSEWMRERREQERKILHGGSKESGEPSRRRVTTRRNPTMVKQEKDRTFDEIVMAIYTTINKRGYQGNGFIEDTLKELNQKGLLEYYVTAYAQDNFRQRLMTDTSKILGRFRFVKLDSETGTETIMESS